MFPSPIAGNQTFTNVVNLAGQLPLLNVSQLEAGHASAVTGDITRLTHGDDPVRTTIFGAVTTDGTAGYYSFLDKSTGAPLVLPENAEVFSLRFISPDADVALVGPNTFNIGFGDAVFALPQQMVQAATQAIVNGTTGGYVQGEQGAGATQAFGGDGDGGPSDLIRNVPAAPNNQLLLRPTAAITGTVEISVEYVVRRDQL